MVAVDAMGGDRAPQQVVEGAVAAARRKSDIGVVLVGDEAVVNACLAELGGAPPHVRVHHAGEVIGMAEAPGEAIRQKRDSSIAVGAKLVRRGEAHAMVSAGNSGAMMAAATVMMGVQDGIDRPAIAVTMPTSRLGTVLLDAGANTDCRPQNLLEFAKLGSAFAEAALGVERPRVGLLNIGEEPSKGNALTKEAHALLRASELNFMGNVEPKEMVRGEVDVVVCDGFAGNLILKAAEGFAELLFSTVRSALATLPQEGANAVNAAMHHFAHRFDYAETGGALLLGVKGVVVIGHGRSNAQAIENAVLLAARAAAAHVGEGRA